MLCQDLDEKIEAEQAARREAQVEINFKLDLLLKTVGEVAGKGPGVMASCACPGDNANPPPWMQHQQQAPPMGMGNMPSLPTLSPSRSSSSDSRGNKGMLANAGHPGDNIGLPPWMWQEQEPDACSARHIVLQRGDPREERTGEAELGKVHEQRARFERFVAQQRQHLKEQTEKVNELLMQQRAGWDAQAAAGTGGGDSGGDRRVGQLSDTCTNACPSAIEPPHGAPPSSALRILPSHLVSGLGLATLTGKRAGENDASNCHGSDFAENGCSNKNGCSTTLAQKAALPLMPSPGGPGAVYEINGAPRRPGHDSDLSRRPRHDSAEKSDAALEPSTVSPLPFPLPDEADVELSDRQSILFNSGTHITSKVWSSLMEKAKGGTPPKASSYGADGRR
jgi:hypothetical protein